MAENGAGFSLAAGNGGVRAADALVSRVDALASRANTPASGANALVGGFHAPANDAHFSQASVNGFEPAGFLLGQAIARNRFRYHGCILAFLASNATPIKIKPPMNVAMPPSTLPQMLKRKSSMGCCVWGMVREKI
jgi:hypothetical protein